MTMTPQIVDTVSPTNSEMNERGASSSTPKAASDDKGLSRLAEIAEAVSMQQDAHQRNNSISQQSLSSETPSSVAAATNSQVYKHPLFRSKTNPFDAVSAALRKRPFGGNALPGLAAKAVQLASLEGPAAKRSRFLSPLGSSLGAGGAVPRPMGLATAKTMQQHNVPHSSAPSSDGSDDEMNDSGGEGEAAEGDEDGKGVRFREYQAEIWSEKFEDLCEFRRIFGHCHVPHTYTQNSALAQWVKRQRYQYKLKASGKRSTLSDERVRLLNKIGFIWNSHDVVWEERLNELVAYKRQYGHCVVPSNYEHNPQLAVWVKRQRRQFKFYQEKKATSMTAERIEKLNRIGFAWDCRKPNSVLRPDTTSPPPMPTKALDQQGVPPSRNAATSPITALATLTRDSHSIGTQDSTVRKGNGDTIQPSVATLPTQHEKKSPIKSKSVNALDKAKLNGLPCEFLSFSRKFTKFPKIKLPVTPSQNS